MQEEEEFDENAPVATGDEDDEKNPTKSSSSVVAAAPPPDTQTEEKDMEAEFASWQAKVGPDFRALESALKPVERFALRVRTEVEPHYSVFYSNEQQRLLDMHATEDQEKAEMWDVEEIEREKEEEEYRALAEGELLATNLTRGEVNRLQRWYQVERVRRNRERRRRLLTGAGWSLVIDPVSSVPFWYNDDTGEANYARPKIIEEREDLERALERGYVAIPLTVMVAVLSFLSPYPDRMNAAGARCTVIVSITIIHIISSIFNIVNSTIAQ